MTEFELLRSSSYCLEFGSDSLHVMHGQTGLDLPVERGPDGCLTTACKARVAQHLQRFLRKKFWEPRLRVFCAVGARGVALRRISLPASNREEFCRLLQLQVESLFPLPPDQLAWGCLRPPDAPLGSSAGLPSNEVVIAAVKREVLEDYSSLLAACNATPVFTLAALARCSLWSQLSGPSASINIEHNSVELALFDGPFPTALRVLPWGGQALLSGGSALQAPSPESPSASLKLALDGHAPPRTVFLTGGDAAQREQLSQLILALGTSADCKPIDCPVAPGSSAATRGLKRISRLDSAFPPLILQISHSNGSVRSSRPAPVKWAALAVCLALFSLILPNLEASFFKPRLTRRLAAIRTDKGRLATIDRELDFLRYLKQNQAPYLDGLFIVARSAPPGAQLNSISFNRRGEVTLRGSMQNPQLVADFRSKLIDSGLFSSVAVEEQTPTPNRQKVNVRISALWKPAIAREAAARAAAAPEPDRPKNVGGPMPFGPPAMMPMPGEPEAPGATVILPGMPPPMEGVPPPNLSPASQRHPRPGPLPKEAKE